VEKHRLVQRQADAYELHEIHALFQEYRIKGLQGHDLSYPFDFNLMFEVAPVTRRASEAPCQFCHPLSPPQFVDAHRP
jgi:hypothetical protein